MAALIGGTIKPGKCCYFIYQNVAIMKFISLWICAMHFQMSIIERECHGTYRSYPIYLAGWLSPNPVLPWINQEPFENRPLLSSVSEVFWYLNNKPIYWQNAPPPILKRSYKWLCPKTYFLLSFVIWSIQCLIVFRGHWTITALVYHDYCNYR